MKGQEKDYRGYKSDEPSVGYSMVNHKIEDDIGNVQVSLEIVQHTPTIGFPEHSYSEDVWFNTRFSWSRISPST